MAANLIRKVAGKTPIWFLKFLGNIWPPYLGAGIKIESISADYRYVRVALKKSWYNSNYVGTQFGGSMYSMTDPFFMIILINNLGKDYIVWDKAARIEFVKPGKTKLVAEFRIDQAQIDLVKEKTNDGGKYVFDLPVDIYDTEKNLIARLEKTLYVRRKLNDQKIKSTT